MVCCEGRLSHQTAGMEREQRGVERRGGGERSGGHSGLMTNADLSGCGACGASRPDWSGAPFNTVTIAEENPVMMSIMNANSDCDHCVVDLL